VDEKRRLAYKEKGNPVRILVIEDEQKLGKALQEGLECEQYRVALAHTGEEGFYLVQTESFDLVILDVMLPGRNGLEILKTMRQHGLKTPVLMLTARDTIEDRVRGLDTGADDYLLKPFAFPELLARVRALGRRGIPESSPKLKVGDLELDIVGRSVTRAGQMLELTAREFELLEYLVRHQGHVVSREMLTRDVWKEAGRHTPLDNVIDVHVARLRRKVDDQFTEKLVHTVRGVGFIVREERD
jgi:two-component system, OmpR family, copper resistance phosphate regulon response regulator CusR